MNFTITSLRAWPRFFLAHGISDRPHFSASRVAPAQRNSDVASAVMSHPFTRVVFRIGDEDAKKLSDGFSFFEAQDLKNLETGQAICRVERSDFDLTWSFPSPLTAKQQRRRCIGRKSLRLQEKNMAHREPKWRRCWQN